MTNKNIIHLNGKDYDAVTGELLGAPAQVVEPMASIKHVKSEAPAVKPPHHAVSQPNSRRTNHAKAHAPDRSKILMRQAVKKPSKPSKRAVAHGALRADKPAMATVVKRHTVSEKRLKRAAHLPKSNHIQHFSSAMAEHRPLHVAEQHQPFSAHAHKGTHTARHQTHHEPSATDLLLEKALAEATAHERKPLKKPRRHLFKVH